MAKLYARAVCKRIVDAHNGTIGVESEKGLGTTFTITLSMNTVEAQVEPMPEVDGAPEMQPVKE